MKIKNKIALSLFTLVFLFTVSFAPRPANAQWVVSVASDVTASLKWVWEKVEKAYDKIQGWVGADLANRTMEMFMNDLAYQVATELATGGTGGKPLFRTESIGKSLQHAQEAAVGEFIGQLSETYFADLGLNLCEPSLQVKLTLTLALIDAESQPAAPKCNWSDVKKRWESFGDSNNMAGLLQFQLSPQGGINNGSYIDNLNAFFDSFSLKQSDLGVFAKLSQEIDERKITAEEITKLTASECQGFIDKATTITEEVKVHCRQQINEFDTLWKSAVDQDAARIAARKEAATNKKLSSIIKDAANNFANTLTSKLMKTWIKGGMWSAFGRSQGEPNYRDTLLAQLRGGSNIRQPRDADIFTDFQNIKISPIESYSFLNDYSVCPDDVQFRKPDNCVVSTDLLQAANNKLTVKEAVERGVLNGAWQFINPSDVLRSNQECYAGAFCYNNLVKLRKANILPVGWEMASQRSDLITPVTLQQVMDCFEDASCSFPANDMAYAVDGEPHNPYYHLVDPNWVLKVPQAYCSAYVYAPVLESPDSSNRQQYCADAQVCLQEDENGNCLDNQYGHCTKSENIWRLGGDQCDQGDIYSGCLIFEHPDNGRQTYLEQTLSYCTADDAGCKRYSQEMNQENNWVLQSIESDDNDLFLNRQAKDCPSSEAGCHEYIVMATDRGINVVPNGSLNDIDNDVSAAFPSSTPDGWLDDGGNPSDGEEYNREDGRVANGYSYGPGFSDRLEQKIYLLPNTTYTISASAAQHALNAGVDAEARISLIMCDNTGNCDDSLGNTNAAGPVPGLGNCTFPTAVEDVDLRFSPADEALERHSCTFTTNQYTAGALLNLLSNTPGLLTWFDDIKVEIVSNLDRVASPYSEYGVGGKITMDGTRFMCTADELGCQGYTPTNGGVMIPAVVNPTDLCPAECVGYATFAETPNIFSTMEGDADVQYYNFIPSTALNCPSSAIGCEEFTNLDEVAQGGEGKEYFTYVRQCVAENLANTYYTWEGSDTAGYQIRTWQILRSNDGSGAPCTNIEPGGELCLDGTPGYAPAICDAAQAAINPNCRQFFDTDGNDYYRLQDRVIYASADCHEYRRTASGLVYKTIPNLSIACSAEFDGCHLYTGNTANNVREIFANNFEQGTFAPWFSWVASLDLSAESLENNGHSVKLTKNGNQSALVRPLPGIIEGSKQYQLSWWMKNDVVIDDIAVTFTADTAVPPPPLPLPMYDVTDSQLRNIAPGAWRYFTLTYTVDTTGVDVNNLVLDIQVTNNASGDNIYFDNIIFKEVGDSISVVRNSWETPIACDSPYIGYHLGCQSYTDTNSRVFNLRSFSNLCRVDAIGCSAVIDTQNSTYPYQEDFNVGNYASTTIVRDSMAYLVPDSSKYCAPEYKGCQALGLPDRSNPYLLNTVYKINNPDQYASTLCNTDGLGCEEYASDKGIYYFRDPGSETCTYQTNVLIGGVSYSGWFKTATLNTANVMGCSDGNGNFNREDLELNNCVWATDAASGLTGYFRKNSLLTPNPVGCWSDEDEFLEADELAVDNFAASCPEDKNLCTTIKDPSDPESCDPSIDGTVLDGVCRDSDGDIMAENSLSECENAAIPGRWTPACQDYYYYKNSNIDEKSCAGMVDKNGGCILLYDANDWMAGHEEVRVLYDSGKTYDENLARAQAVSAVACNPEVDGSCSLDSNMLVKVKKDRQCSEWLACRSSTAVWDKDNNRYRTVCDDVAACVEYDRNNNITKCKEWAPVSPDLLPLTTAYYQNRDTGTFEHLQWSDEEYLGYSIPDLLPIKDLVTNEFDDGNIRATYPYFNVINNSGTNYYDACRNAAGVNIDGITCSVGVPAGVFTGECKNGFCWLNPKLNDTSTSTLALSTRGYAMADSPFPHSIFNSDDESQGLSRSYNQANFCQIDKSDPPEDRMNTKNGCEQSYQKVTFGINDVRYYPTSLGGLPRAVCTAGNKSLFECNNNTDCNTEDASDGLCEKITKIENVNNWSGICLNYDYNNKIVNDNRDDFYCNQWYPAEQISGTNSLFENYQAAGYYEQSGRDALFCAVTDQYRASEERIYCGKFDNIGECQVLIKIPVGATLAINNMSALSMLSRDYLKSDVFGWFPANSTFETDGSNNQVGSDRIEKVAHGTGSQDTKFNNMIDFVVPFGERAQEHTINEIKNAWGTTGATGQIEMYFYDEDVNLEGFGNSGAAVKLSGGFRAHWGPECDLNAQPSNWVCGMAASAGGGHQIRDNAPAGKYHTVYSRVDGGDGAQGPVYDCDGGCGWNKSKVCREVYCNPLEYNYYVKAELPASTYNCLDDNCSASGTGLLCLQTGGSAFVTLGATCAPTSTDPNCEFISCVNSLVLVPGHNTAGIFMEDLNNPGTYIQENGINYCSDFGQLTKNNFSIPLVSGQVCTFTAAENLSGCYQYLFDVIPTNIITDTTDNCPVASMSDIDPEYRDINLLTYNKATTTAGVNENLYYQIFGSPSGVPGCLSPVADQNANCDNSQAIRDISSCVRVYGYPLSCSYYPVRDAGTDCDPLGNTPLNCYQQCQVVTQLDANADLSWVRTDMWWRYSKNEAPLKEHGVAPNDWTSFYFHSISGLYTPASSTVHYRGVTGETGDIFTHFGAALDYVNRLDQPVVTRVPLGQLLPMPSAATFFSSINFTNAAEDMSRIFASVYNLAWVAGDYDPVATSSIRLDNENDLISPNVFAGSDYNPVALKVCGDSACVVRNTADQSIAGYWEGITINEQQNTNISADESLFVAVKAYFYAHPDHMPVTNIIMDWGDGNISSSPGRYKNALFNCNADENMPNTCTATSTGSCDATPPGLQGFGGLDNACRQGYKIFYHDYQYTTNSAYDCDGSVAGEPVINGATCFKPSMYIVDRWGRGALPADAIPYDAWIVINP